jgi:hypothetical protein
MRNGLSLPTRRDNTDRTAHAASASWAVLRWGVVGGLLLSYLPAAEAAPAAEQPPAGAAVSYQIPAEAPQGEVQVLSLGVADVTVPSLIGSERLVHWRVVAQNHRDPQAWVLDARDQVLQLSDGSSRAPLFAEASTARGAGQATIRAGQLAYLDLFFSAEGNDPPSAALTWRVRRGGSLIVARTVFERMPELGFAYVHYRPAQYEGGAVRFGNPWCYPTDGWSDWLRPYSSYCHYSYYPWPDGYVVARGHRRWNYARDRLTTSVPRDTVRTRWRDRGSVTARPAPANPMGSSMSLTDPTMGPTPPTAASSDHTRWGWHRQEMVRRRSGEWTAVSPTESSGRTTSPPSTSLALPTEPSSSSRSIATSDSSSSFRSHPSAAASSAPSPSASPPAPPPSSSGSDSVGSRWRSR